jgi:FlaA1/EpsC-like NDP-sugar epimerase
MCLEHFNLAEAALKYNVSNFVLISSDKAVRSTNIMGATKRLAEICVQSLYDNQNQKSKFAIVRFGNVLESSGSVIPKFKQQIKEGGPVTLTHPDVTRYFMTIIEASQLVIQAGAMAEKCEGLCFGYGGKY